MIKETKKGFQIEQDNYTFIQHTLENPVFFVGKKNLDIEMDKGEFNISDNTEYHPATYISVKDNTILFKEFAITLEVIEACIHLTFKNLNQPLKVRLSADSEEKVYGLGEHFTSLNHRGHVVKNWVEEHITRKQIYNKIIRRLFKIKAKTWKFEEYKTYFIIPSFISSNNYFCHIDSDGYGVFNFKNKEFHEITFVSTVREIVLKKEHTLIATSSSLCKFHHITPKLPDWVYDGMILGVQGGTEKVNTLTMTLVDNGAKICGIWSQDWCGELFTYFGKQVLWNWEENKELYPDLKNQIESWNKQNIKFLTYVNPYLNHNVDMFTYAKDHNYLVMNEDKTVFLTQATSFKFGIVDLTNIKAYNWFKEIIKKNYIELGISGWMADFGEYLPTKCVLTAGNGEDFHNKWPDLWIQLNREVLEETNTLSKVLFFNRAGYKDNSKYTTLVWQGDQHVDFTDDFGIKSIVRSALSLSMSGIGVVHSDVGGYTTVPGIKRSKELYLRWLEMNTFSPVLRSHEGNKPWVNAQPYSDEDTVEATVTFSTVHALLKPYLLAVEKEYQDLGYPMMRPLLFHHDIESEYVYLLGEDLYVCPILNKRQKIQKVIFPTDGWIHIVTGKRYDKGVHSMDAIIGMPPVFYKEKSKHIKTFSDITKYFQK